MSSYTESSSSQLEKYTYICEHEELGAPSAFIERLLDKNLIRLPEDGQLLIRCSPCMRELPPEDKRRNIIAALPPAISRGTKDAMTIIVVFENLWVDFYDKPTEEAISLLHRVFLATGKTFQRNYESYRKVLDVVNDRFPMLLPLDIFCTTTNSTIDPLKPLPVDMLQSQWGAYERASNKFTERARRISDCHAFFASDLTKLFKGILQQALCFVAIVLAPPQEEHLHFDIVAGFCRINASIREADLVDLRGIMEGTATLARQLRIKLHQASWQAKIVVRRRHELETLSLKLGAINAIARQVLKLDGEKRQRWERWREASNKWDPLVEDVLRQRVQKNENHGTEQSP